MSAGPEAPRGSGSRTVPSPPRGPRPLPVRGDTPPLGSREPWECGARGRVSDSRGAVRGARVRVLSGSGGERVAAGQAGALGRREGRGPGAGCRPEGAGGAGLSPGAAEVRGHTHPGRLGPPPPRPGPGGSEDGWRAGARRAGAAEPLAGGSGSRAGSVPCAPAWTSCFSGRRRGHFAAGGGEGSGIVARRGSGGRGGGGSRTAPGCACDALPSAAPRPGARLAGRVAVSPGSFIPALD